MASEAAGGDRPRDTGGEKSPTDLLVDLLIYAPVGLLYEYDEVVPRLVRRGKSQVQLAQVIAKMATTGQAPGLGAVANGMVDLASGQVARMITDFGAAVGLAPTPEDRRAGAADAAETVDTTDRSVGTTPPEPTSGPVSRPGAGAAPDDDDPEVAEATQPAQLPIARYDDLTAKEIIGLLDELDADQLDRIRAHETANRNRKTVLGKLDRLQS